MRAASLAILTMCLICLSGCDNGNAGTVATTAPAGSSSPAPTNRIDVPATVRENLGITFAKVEPRRVAATVRVPGRFELLPSARREYRAPLPGWVSLLVRQYDAVGQGTPIYRADSPEWHRLRKQLHESQAGIESAIAALSVAEQTKAEAVATIEALQKRTEALAGAEVRRAELETELTTRRASIPRLDAEIRARQAAVNEARHDFTLEIDGAASLLGMSAKALTSPAETGDAAGHDDGHAVQRWFAINQIERAAAAPGVVETLHVTDGTWVEANTLIATTIDPTAIRFRATGLQSDLGRFKDGLPAVVLPPQGASTDGNAGVAGALRIGLTGDPDQRTIELLVTPEKPAAWARPGVSTLLEIVTSESGAEDLAIPASAVVRDELTHIFFRRDPKDPDKVIRTEADLGVSDGKWVVIRSGVKAGDEVVLDGAYELKLSGSGKPAGGGHFHADGTWHAEPDK